MSTQVEFNIGELAFGVHVSVYTHVLNIKVLGLYRRLESLSAAPRHILDCDASSFGNENEVRQAVDDDGTF